YGNCVVVAHGNGRSTLYAHCSSLAVSEGARVRKGQILGRVGSTGFSTGPHLHFEVRINGRPVNPLSH
ncbi:MAG: M23 family metallopeptidase, partial [Armatimonadetes bacterium]|nr:M23 family metallopeptidase [Armatimonadota bacterium]